MLRHFAPLSVVLVAISSAACGGNVVFVDDGGGGDGTGASGSVVASGVTAGQGGAGTTSVTATATSSSTTSTGSGVSCQNDDCMIGQVVCSCTGQCALCNDLECFLMTTRTQCQWARDGAQCDCIVEDGTTGAVVGSCFQGDLDCDTTTGCCAPLFEEAILNGP